MGVLLPEKEDKDKDDETKNKFANKDIEYPNLQLIICRKGIIKNDCNDKAHKMPEE